MKWLLAVPLLLLPTAVSAREIRSSIVDSVQLTVDGPALQSTRVGSSYSVSGTNVSVTTLGGLDLSNCSSSSPASISAGSYSINTDGQSFSFSESALIGDTTVTSQDALSTNGRVSTPSLYSDSVQSQGGTVGDLAGSLSGTGISSVTAGGVGTTAIGQRTVELSVFN